MKQRKKVLVAMSGGVDSSVAAFLLQQQGYDVTGVTFLLWDGDGCGSSSDIADAQAICRQLGVPHLTFDFRSLFRESVIDPFAEEYQRGRTPNPCVFCNRAIKFAALLRRADELGFPYIATGHYASIEYGQDGLYHLFRAAHAEKDQSYVLYHLSQEILSRFLLPLGTYPKPEIRRIAEENHLISANRPDSQDICFIPDGDYAAFLASYTGKSLPRGNFVDESGKVLGPHKGIQFYTIGQRKRLGIALGHPVFVQAIHPETNTVTLVSDESRLFRQEISADQLSFIAGQPPAEPFSCLARIRYSTDPAPALVTVEGDCARICFEQPQRAPTAGQSVVFYRGNELLGGGVIR